MPFEGFELSDFWREDSWARKYACPPLMPAIVAEAERMLGYKLPASYIWLMERQNGGVPVKTCFPTCVPTSWADDHIMIETIFGVDVYNRVLVNSILTETKLMVEEWGYPPIGIAICDCPTGGHQEVFLDYRACGPRGEPKVVYVDQEDAYSILPLADTFEDFVRGLADSSAYEDEDE